MESTSFVCQVKKILWKLFSPFFFFNGFKGLEPSGESGGNTNNAETELDLVALGIDIKNVNSEDLCKLVSGSSREKRQAGNYEADHRSSSSASSDSMTTMVDIFVDPDDQGNETSDNGSSRNQEGQRNRENDEAEQSGSTAPMVDIFVNPQKAEVRKAFEEQTVKKYQDVFANIDLKKVIICILNPSFSLEILI